MSETNTTDEYANIGPAPGDATGGPYLPTEYRRGGGRGGGGFIWFGCRIRGRDRVFQLANLKDFEPTDADDRFAWFHFSGVDVGLEGSDMLQVSYRIFLGHCTLVNEYREGQIIKPGDPVIRHIHFIAPPTDSGQAKTPKHEPETQGKQGARAN